MLGVIYIIVYYSIIAMKQIISFTLSEEAITVLDNTSKALGKNRSEFLDWVLLKGFCWPPRVKAKLDEINRLQQTVALDQKEEMQKEGKYQ
jgi:hypothetical protein